MLRVYINVVITWLQIEIEYIAISGKVVLERFPILEFYFFFPEMANHVT